MVALRIAKYVEEKGIKQKAIAAAIGISPQAMSETLAGRRTLSADEYRDICIFLEVPYSKFLEDLDAVA
ncbi:MAG: helix-turn-helix transcriptional regulator [Eggerthellaceae bacterium]|nr:helix-turn-helix transcriptional regulator [Eggerthellaceae bacterium]